MPDLQLPYIPDLYDSDLDRFAEDQNGDIRVLDCWMWTVRVVDIEDQEDFHV